MPGASRSRGRAGGPGGGRRAAGTGSPEDRPSGARRVGRPSPGRPPLLTIWRRLDWEQRAAGAGAVLLIVSTIGPFSFVEAAVVLVAAAVLLLVERRAEEREFHLPFGDGAVTAAAGVWCAVLIAVRLFDRPLGQGLLALACAAILVGAGVRQRATREADDLPTDERPTEPLVHDRIRLAGEGQVQRDDDRRQRDHADPDRDHRL